MWRSECRVVGCRDGREPQIFSKLEGGGREEGGREGGGKKAGLQILDKDYVWY